MNIEEALSKVKGFVQEIEHLRSLPHGNQEYSLWVYKASDVLKAAFRTDSDEYRRFTREVEPFYYGASEEQRREQYQKDLTKYETALLSILNKYEMVESAAALTRNRYQSSSLLYWMEVAWHRAFKGLYWIRSHWKLSGIGALIAILAVVGTNYGQVLSNTKWVLDWFLSIVG